MNLLEELATNDLLCTCTNVCHVHSTGLMAGCEGCWCSAAVTGGLCVGHRQKPPCLSLP